MSVIRNLIEYFGIARYLPDEDISFAQINVQDEVTPILNNIYFKEISKVHSKAIINETKVVKTLRGQSLDGVNLTGTKVVVDGEINFKIEYIADNEAQSVHSLNHSIPYITSVVVPENLVRAKPVHAEVYIEDVNASQISDKVIFLTSMLLITIE